MTDPTRALNDLAETMERGAGIVRKGWTQGTSWTPDGRQFCMTGALFEAEGLRTRPQYWTPETPEGMRKRLRYTLSLVALEDTVGRNAPDWNDEEGRTQDEAADAMERCAKELRNGVVPPSLHSPRHHGTFERYQHLCEELES